ncbi:MULTISPECIES: type II toxin-antitoxin system RelE family toxin [unclassified Wolbachia]|uniref:type II toxin-antitoxin system RelE family toxin n=1 Tax=unclassified Wolbachia TaxID=2640676 RepID=UPI0022207DE6|nr:MULTISPECIES: type II toxin-antitoxin system RelE/ParE family toxin [unclassified Wolbachia]WGJ62213.1 type II toxin-antitoxin system RelE/ParE family toxin [Wolbachia endosymbiont of Frankliniella intonsa]
MGLEHYKVKSLKSVVERDLPNLQKTIRLRIQKAIKERLTVDPINLGEPLHHSLKGRRRLRVVEYRIIYRVNQLEQIVTITEIGHRCDIYKK